MTESQRRALEIIRDHGPLTPGQFAAIMWPDSDGWLRSAKCGAYGVSRGGGMRLAGGGYLGKLNRLGWTQSVFGFGHVVKWELSKEGRAVLSKESMK